MKYHMKGFVFSTLFSMFLIVISVIGQDETYIIENTFYTLGIKTNSSITRSYVKCTNVVELPPEEWWSGYIVVNGVEVYTTLTQVVTIEYCHKNDPTRLFWTDMTNEPPTVDPNNYWVTYHPTNYYRKITFNKFTVLIPREGNNAPAWNVIFSAAGLENRPKYPIYGRDEGSSRIYEIGTQLVTIEMGTYWNRLYSGVYWNDDSFDYQNPPAAPFNLIVY